MSPAPVPPVVRQARQKAALIALAGILFLGGLVVLLFLSRIPWPMRILLGGGDLIIGAVLLLFLRQQFPKSSR